MIRYDIYNDEEEIQSVSDEIERYDIYKARMKRPQ
jgi:hypothetical protein